MFTNFRNSTPNRQPQAEISFGVLGRVNSQNTGLFYIYLVYLFVIFIVLMNILIAIVSDSFDDAMSRAQKLFWFSRLDLIAESGMVFHPGPRKDGGVFPNRLVRDKDALRVDIEDHLK